MGYAIDKALAKSYVASDTFLQSNDSVADRVNPVYGKMKTISVINDVYPTAQLRICWTQSSPGGGNSTGKLCKNGVDIAGTESLGNATFTFDISFTDLKYKDTLELWGKNDAATVRMTNYRVKGTVTDFINA